MCSTRCPYVFISALGLNPYFSAGIASAAPTMFLAKRVNCPLTVDVTGFETCVCVVASCCAETEALHSNANATKIAPRILTNHLQL